MAELQKQLDKRLDHPEGYAVARLSGGTFFIIGGDKRQDLSTAYDDKDTELPGRLRQALMAIGNCEARQYNDPDWYKRFGYMF